MSSQKLNVGVIGAGVAGIVAAHRLSKKHNVTLIEAADYIGGHTNTIVLEDGPDAGTPVDTGFIVLNERTYPHFQSFLSELGVPIRKTDMSFSYYCRETDLCYSSDFPNGVFAQRRNALNPSFLGMLRDSLRFNKTSVQDLRHGRLSQQTVKEYLTRNRYSKWFIEHQLMPTAAAIWSSSSVDTMEFPIEALVKFYENHGLLSHFGGPGWYVVEGGSHAYVKAFLQRFPGQVLKNSPVEAIQRQRHQVDVKLQSGQTIPFDKVIIAAHADQALNLLSDPSSEEQRLLGTWRYSNNHTVLHTDTNIMSQNRRIWASWNYIKDPRASDTHPVNITYYMNRLQGLKNVKGEYFVTLNDPQPISQKHIIKEINYTHPCYTLESMKHQKDLPSLNGQRNTYFCGSYFGYGFHEDAVRSSVDVARHFDLEP